MFDHGGKTTAPPRINGPPLSTQTSMHYSEVTKFISMINKTLQNIFASLFVSHSQTAIILSSNRLLSSFYVIQSCANKMKWNNHFLHWLDLVFTETAQPVSSTARLKIVDLCNMKIYIICDAIYSSFRKEDEMSKPFLAKLKVMH